MSKETNRFGLDRYIPAEVRRSVRKRCGFGCVVCGRAIYQYDHFDPEFADAKEHNADGIILLCGSCHTKKDGFLSKSTLAVHAASPCAHKAGFSFEAFDLKTTTPSVMIGSVEFSNCLVPVAIHDVAVLAIEPPEELDGPFRLSAYICDVDGNHLFTILRNEWRTNSSSWDVEVVGPLITIRKTAGDVALKIRANPPHGLTIEKLTMKFGGTRLFTQKDSVLTTAHDGRVGSFSGGSFSGSIGLHYRWIERYRVNGWGAGFGRPISLKPNEKSQMIISF